MGRMERVEREEEEEEEEKERVVSIVTELSLVQVSPLPGGTVPEKIRGYQKKANFPCYSYQVKRN